jgi:hypothetical protein
MPGKVDDHELLSRAGGQGTVVVHGDVGEVRVDEEVAGVGASVGEGAGDARDPRGKLENHGVDDYPEEPELTDELGGVV